MERDETEHLLELKKKQQFLFRKSRRNRSGISVLNNFEVPKFDKQDSISLSIYDFS
jgi:hypothetical protein